MILTIATILRLLSPHASQYTEDVNRLASRYGFDPLLVAAVIHSESRFIRSACRSGSHGLMQIQLRPRSCTKTMLTATSQGLYIPRINIKRGVKLMWWWRNWWRKHHSDKSFHWLLFYNQGFGKCPSGRRSCHRHEREPIQLGRIGGYAERVLKTYRKLKSHNTKGVL